MVLEGLDAFDVSDSVFPQWRLGVLLRITEKVVARNEINIAVADKSLLDNVVLGDCERFCSRCG